MPGTINSKNGEQVKIIQRWDGNAPNVRLILSDFLHHLIQKRIDVIKERKKRESISKKKNVIYRSNNKLNSIPWIDNLLQTPIEDHRKYCLWKILIPYLLNVKRISKEEAAPILKEWLGRCNQEKRLDFNINQRISSDLK